MDEINKKLDDWHESQRETVGINYMSVIDSCIDGDVQEKIVSDALFVPDDGVVGALASSLVRFYHGISKFSTNSWMLTEHDDGRRERTLNISAEPFCAGVHVPLPARNSNSQYIDIFPLGTFKSRINIGILLFDNVVVRDPCPSLFEWATSRSYIYTNAVGIKGDAYSLRWSALKPIDYDHAAPNAFPDQSRRDLLAWLKFCIEYRDLIDAGKIYVVPDRYPDWLVSYSSGAESDKPKFGNFQHIMESNINSCAVPVFGKIPSKMAGERLDRQVLENIFWQSHYLGDAAVCINTLTEARVFLSVAREELGRDLGTNVSASMSQALFSLNYGLRAGNLTASELASISGTDELVSEFRNIIREVRDLAVLAGDEHDRLAVVLRSKFDAFESKVEGLSKRSNFVNDMFVKCRDAGLASFGAGATTYMTAPEVNAVLWSGLGAAFPLLFMIPYYISKGVAEHNVSVNATTLLAKLHAD